MIPRNFIRRTSPQERPLCRESGSRCLHCHLLAFFDVFRRSTNIGAVKQLGKRTSRSLLSLAFSTERMLSLNLFTLPKLLSVSFVQIMRNQLQTALQAQTLTVEQLAVISMSLAHPEGLLPPSAPTESVVNPAQNRAQSDSGT